MNDGGNHTPNLEGLLFDNLDRLVDRVLREEPKRSAVLLQSFHGQISVEYRHDDGKYSITVKNPSGVQRGVASTLLDGVPVNGAIPLAGDNADHTVIVTLGPPTPPLQAE